MPHTQPCELPPELEHQLIRALLRLWQTLPGSERPTVSWGELADRMPEQCRATPDMLRACTVHCNNEGFLRGLSTTDGGFTLEGLTPLGERMLRDELAIARRYYRLLYLPPVLFGLAELIWVVYRYVIRG